MAFDEHSPGDRGGVLPIEVEVAKGRRERRLLVGGTIALLVGGLGFLAFSGLSSSTRWDLTVSQVVPRSGEFATQDVRVRGTLVDDSLQRMPGDKFGVTFEMFTGGDKIRVDYYDKAPDPLVNGAEVTVEGRFASGRRFLASRVYAKCPSKYEGQLKPGYEGKRVGGVRAGEPERAAANQGPMRPDGRGY